MRANVVQMGKKPALQRTGIESGVEIEADAFMRMAESGDDKLLDPDQSTKWDLSQWRW